MHAPKRIAVLRPELTGDEPAAVVHAAGLLLWGALVEAAARHPRLAVADLDECSIPFDRGNEASRAAHVEVQLGQHRRDEVLWLEALLDKPGAVRLHVAARDGQTRSFDALGQQLGEQVQRVIAAWLAAGELDALPHPIDDVSAADVVAQARVLAQIFDEPVPDDGSPPPFDVRVERLTPALRVAALRLLGRFAGVDTAELVGAIDPEHPSVLWAQYRAASRERKDWAQLRRTIAAAPGWATPWLELKVVNGDPQSPSRLEALAAAGMAAFLDPARTDASEQLADVLSTDRRRDEGLRSSARGAALHDGNASAHIGMLDRYLATERLGDWLETAHRAGWLHGCPMDSPWPWTNHQVTIDLCVSTALMNNGRLDEAIALRNNRLELASGSWPRAQKTLDSWRKDPRFVAWSYAREGFARGEDARTVEGFSRIEPGDGVDVGMLIEALVATGNEREVPLAWAQFGSGRRFNTPYARLAAIAGLFAAGEWRSGIEELFAFELQLPSRDDHAAVAHAARMLVAAPPEVLRAAVDARRREGAVTSARFLARTLGDFSGVDLGAPPPLAAVAFDPGWLASFGDGVRGRTAVDALFEHAFGAGDVQAAADELVDHWSAALGAEGDDKVTRAQATAYVAAHALTRYLALGTQPPTVLAGACRTVAAETMQSLRRQRGDLRDADLAALLAALEPLAGRVDEREYEQWLATLERALDLDERWQGRVKAPPGVAAHLFGPEQLALATRRLHELVHARADGWAADAAPLAARLAWLTGRTGVEEWSLAVEALSPGDALDQQLTCAAIARGRVRAPAIRAAHLLFAADQPEAALRVLVGGVGAENDGYKDPLVKTLAEPWARSGLDVPFGFQEAVAKAYELGQKGQAAAAERVLAWPVALDANNAEAHRNLGLFMAQQDRVHDALEHLIRATRDQGTQLCAGILYQAGHLPSALTVLDYASRWYLRADQWLTYSVIVYAAQDNPRTVRAYRLASELDPEALDLAHLNRYAGVLDDVGDYIACETIARKLVDKAGQDPTWISNGALQMACALIGQGRFDEALPFAEQAAAVNPLPDNTAVCQTVLQRARTRTKAEVPAALATVRPRPEWYAALDRGELAQVAERIRDDDWGARRAALRASRFRYSSENQIAVTDRARAAAERVLDDSRGATALAVVVCRYFALRLRADALFPREPVPRLGDRMTRDAFYVEFRARGGVVLDEAPPPPPPFVDREVLPDQPIATASAYVALLRDLARLSPAEALRAHRLDDASYGEVAKAWGSAFDADTTLWQTIADGLAN